MRAEGHRINSHGVTLIEALVVLLILSLIVAGISKMLVSAWASEDTIRSQNEVQKEAQLAVDNMVDGLLGQPGGQAAPGTQYGVRSNAEVQSGTADSITVNFRNDNRTLLHTISYNLQNGNLIQTRTPAGGGQAETKTICRNVTNLGFTYNALHFRSGQPLIEPINSNINYPSETLRDAQSVLVSLTVSNGRYNATETSLVLLRNWTAP
jgi:Tfp pilus assembly protein PilW